MPIKAIIEPGKLWLNTKDNRLYRWDSDKWKDAAMSELGKIKSKAKSDAARRNGKKGGRPRIKRNSEPQGE